MTPLDRVLARLRGVRRSGAAWEALCPTHDDGEQSLSVAEGDDGRVLLHCHAGCAVEAIVAAIGLTLRDLYPPRAGRGRESARETIYVIRAADGRPVAEHVRMDRPAGKRMWWRLPGARRTGLGGVRTCDLPLYGTDRLRELPDGATVVATEGERAADALTARGIAAVGTVTGASGTPSDDVLRVLVGRDVVLWPDADDAGRGHMTRIAAHLTVLGTAPRWLTVAGAAEGDDAADLTVDTATVRQWIAAAPAWTAMAEAATDDGQLGCLRWRTAREIGETTPATVPWVVMWFLVLGAVTELDGKIKAAGKTTFLMWMIRCILDGLPFLSQPTTKAKVVLLTEQGDSSLRVALARAGLLERDDLIVLSYCDARSLTWAEIVDAAVTKAEEIGARVLAVDTLSQFARFKGEGENTSGDGQDAIEPLQVAAAEHNLAVIDLRHEKKADADIGDAARGSTAIGGAVDVILSLRRVKSLRPTIRSLRSLSRFDETPPELLVEVTDHGYVIVDPEEAKKLKSEADRQKLANALPPEPEAALSAAEIATAAGVGHKTAVAILNALVEEAVAGRRGKGKRGDPFRYFAALPTDSDGFLVSSRPVGEKGCEETNPAAQRLGDCVASMGSLQGENPPDSFPRNVPPHRGAEKPRNGNGLDADGEAIE